MTAIKHKEVIKDWFQKNSGTLLLPDGWYGRPYDNLHELTYLEEKEGLLTLQLDNLLSLRFEGLAVVREDAGNLVLGPFERLVFTWRAYGRSDAAQGVREFVSGEVKIARH